MIIILLGPPGAGKGTQSNLIANKYNFFHFSTGNILRDQVEKKTEIGKEIEARLQTAVSSWFEYSIISVHKLEDFIVPRLLSSIAYVKSLFNDKYI